MFFCCCSICLILAERCDQVADYEEGVKSRTQELEVGQTIGISKGPNFSYLTQMGLGFFWLYCRFLMVFVDLSLFQDVLLVGLKIQLFDVVWYFNLYISYNWTRPDRNPILYQLLFLRVQQLSIKFCLVYDICSV